MEEKESKVDHAGEENAVPTDKASVSDLRSLTLKVLSAVAGFPIRHPLFPPTMLTGSCYSNLGGL